MSIDNPTDPRCVRARRHYGCLCRDTPGLLATLRRLLDSLERDADASHRLFGEELEVLLKREGVL